MQAVCRQPSSRSNSLLTGKLTGNFANLAHDSARQVPLSHRIYDNYSHARHYSCVTEQGIFSRYQGIEIPCYGSEQRKFFSVIRSRKRPQFALLQLSRAIFKGDLHGLPRLHSRNHRRQAERKISDQLHRTCILGEDAYPADAGDRASSAYQPQGHRRPHLRSRSFKQMQYREMRWGARARRVISPCRSEA